MQEVSRVDHHVIPVVETHRGSKLRVRRDDFVGRMNRKAMLQTVASYAAVPIRG